jgi:hypothetical protein
VREERIGPHRLILGDCREVMPGLGRVDAVLTDPPYGNSNHDGDWNARLNEHREIESKPIANDDADGMRRVVDAALTAAVPLMAGKVSACCCFCGGGGGLVQCSAGWPSGWIKRGFSSFIRSSGTSATPALASVTGGSMKC